MAPVKKFVCEISEKPELFAALVKKEGSPIETKQFDVFLINPTSIVYKRVVFLSGADTSNFGELIKASEIVKERGKLPPFSALEIDETDDREIDDFVVWYHVDLHREDEAIEHIFFVLPKMVNILVGKPSFQKIPILNRQGIRIEIDRGEAPSEIKKRLRGKRLLALMAPRPGEGSKKFASRIWKEVIKYLPPRDGRT